MDFDSTAPARVPERLRFQARACAELGSPLYADLLQRAAADYEAGGPLRELLSRHAEDPGPSALALRLMGAVRRLTLDGRAPELAALYEDPDRDPELTWRAFASVVGAQLEPLRDLVKGTVQTNEVGRSGPLLAGFAAVASATALPLRLLEAGASAGLNLRFDRYRYELGQVRWGPADAPLVLDPEVTGTPPDPGAITVASRAGCDAAPLDPASEEDRLTLLSYVWPDQRRRLERLRAALELAAGLEVAVERRGAGVWIAERLAELPAGVATVVFHSIFIQYVGDAERDAFVGAITAAGERTSTAAPLAWLRMEPAGAMAEVRLTLWPGAEERLVARAGYHGSPIELAG